MTIPEDATEASRVACPNCRAPLPVPRSAFCPACGQETEVRPPTLGHFLQQFGGAYLATEGALWRTLTLLLVRPGELTLRYLAGRRKHYVLPLRLYLTVSVVTLLLIRALGGLHYDASLLGGFDPRKANGTQIDFGHGRAGMKDGTFYCERLPLWLCSKLQARVDLDAKSFQHEIEQVGERIVANLGKALFVMLPAFAMWLQLAYLNRRLRYTEHLVFALHLHAFWFIALGLTLVDWAWLSTAAVVSMPVYALLAMRRVYGGRIGRLLLRALAISAFYGVTLGLAMAGLVLWSLLA